MASSPTIFTCTSKSEPLFDFEGFWLTWYSTEDGDVLLLLLSNLSVSVIFIFLISVSRSSILDLRLSMYETASDKSDALSIRDTFGTMARRA
uniref:Transmembrane protein n=1 Tax=Arabidopsis thaliana TaxID=3702 RepID=Q8LD52_ARATH|nr:unknown [Arabidopsis thaliana]